MSLADMIVLVEKYQNVIGPDGIEGPSVYHFNFSYSKFWYAFAINPFLFILVRKILPFFALPWGPSGPFYKTSLKDP